VFSVRGNGFLADVQTVGNLVGVLAFCEQLHDLPFSRG
jgi:hypothetical protein